MPRPDDPGAHGYRSPDRRKSDIASLSHMDCMAASPARGFGFTQVLFLGPSGRVSDHTGVRRGRTCQSSEAQGNRRRGLRIAYAQALMHGACPGPQAPRWLLRCWLQPGHFLPLPQGRWVSAWDRPAVMATTHAVRRAQRTLGVHAHPCSTWGWGKRFPAPAAKIAIARWLHPPLPAFRFSALRRGWVHHAMAMRELREDQVDSRKWHGMPDFGPHGATGRCATGDWFAGAQATRPAEPRRLVHCRSDPGRRLRYLGISPGHFDAGDHASGMDLEWAINGRRGHGSSRMFSLTRRFGCLHSAWIPHCATWVWGASAKRPQGPPRTIRRVDAAHYVGRPRQLLR